MATFDISSRPKVPKPSGKAVFSAKHDKNVTGIDNVFSKLNDEIAWRDDITHLGGALPRLFALQAQIVNGQVPRYTKPMDQYPIVKQFTPTVDLIRQILEKKYNTTLNHCILQLYRDGEDHISKHSDKTLDIAHGSLLVNYTAGAERAILWRSKTPDENGNREKIVQRPEHDSSLAWDLDTNRHFTHVIKRELQGHVVGPNISLTFQQVATFVGEVDGKMKLYGRGAPKEGEKGMSRDELCESLRKENTTTDWVWEDLYGRGYNTCEGISTYPNDGEYRVTFNPSAPLGQQDTNTSPSSSGLFTKPAITTSTTLRILPPELRLGVFKETFPISTEIAARTAPFTCVVDAFIPDPLLHAEFKQVYVNRTNCRLCDQDFVSRNQLHNHFQNDHQLIAAVRTCPDCLQIFRSNRPLQTHLRNRGNKTYYCAGCTDRFTCKERVEHCRGPAGEDIEKCLMRWWLWRRKLLLPEEREPNYDVVHDLGLQFISGHYYRGVGFWGQYMGAQRAWQKGLPGPQFENLEKFLDPDQKEEEERRLGRPGLPNTR